jgi:hypothetical protein
VRLVIVDSLASHLRDCETNKQQASLAHFIAIFAKIAAQNIAVS